MGIEVKQRPHFDRLILDALLPEIRPMISPLPLNKSTSQDVTRLLAGITEEIERGGFALRAGNDMRAILRMRGLDAWPAT